MARPLAVALGVAITLLGCHVRAQPPLSREVGRIELPGVNGRIDHLAIDSEGRRVFLAALGADKVEVVDLKSGQRVAEIAGLREPQGIVFLPRTQRLFVAGGESDDVTAFESGRRFGAAGGLPNADNLRLFAPSGQLFAGYDSGLIAIAQLDCDRPANRVICEQGAFGKPCESPNSRSAAVTRA